MLRATETVLGDAGGDWELYVTESLEEVPLADITGVVQVEGLRRKWSWDLRRPHFQEDDAFRKLNDEARTAGKPIKYMYRHLYCPDKGMFCSLPESMLKVTGHYCEVGPIDVWSGGWLMAQGV